MRPRRPLALAAALTAACLGPQVSDEVLDEGLILPAGTTVPAIADDLELAAQIDEHDGVGATVPLYTGFVGGQAVRYWDFGPAPDFAAPMYILYRDVAGTLERVAHPPIVDLIPGDPSYSSFCNLFIVEVTDLYDGQVIPSVAALNQARDIGLVGAPDRESVVINCPPPAPSSSKARRGSRSTTAASPAPTSTSARARSRRTTPPSPPSICTCFAARAASRSASRRAAST
jgi:hypothetical protein